MENADKLINILTDRLQEKGLSCPICGKTDFHFMRQGYNTLVLTDSVRDPKPNGKFIPTVFMVCDHCGFISQHIEKVLIDPPKTN